MGWGFRPQKKRQPGSISLYADVRKLLLPKYDIIYTFGPFAFLVPNTFNLTTGLLGRADSQFIWNNHFLEPLLHFPEVAGFLVPIMHGFIGFASTPSLGTKVPHRYLSYQRERTVLRSTTTTTTNRPTNGVLSGQLPPPFVLTCTLF